MAAPISKFRTIWTISKQIQDLHEHIFEDFGFQSWIWTRGKLLQLLTAFRYQMIPEKINSNFFRAAISETITTENPKSEIRVSPNVSKVLMNKRSPHPDFFPEHDRTKNQLNSSTPNLFGWLKTLGDGFLVTYLIPGCVRRGVKLGSENLFHRRQCLDFQN